MNQKNPEWYAQRLGKFTASEFHKLMCGGRREMTPEELEAEKKNGGKRKTIDTLFGDTAMTYIDEKLTEILTNGTSCDYGFQGNKATEWGEYCEPMAREMYMQKTCNQVTECGFIEISERFGGSPDGLIKNGHIEIKCPWVASNHVKNLWLKDAKDLKNEHFDYYIQCQVNLIATRGECCDFISFDPRVTNPKFQIKILSIRRDEEIIKEIDTRYKQALKILNDKINQLYEL